MSATAVLKFGSSVLADARSLDDAVHEIYRELRAGRRVVAVVSALGATTQRLFDLAERMAPQAGGEAAAVLVSTGELRAVGLLALALERSGIPCTPFDSGRLGLITRGELLDAEPLQIDVAALRRALLERPVAVVPGFVGRDERGRSTLLGRGGSDLTALFVARSLRAEVCRLVKDVDGVYDRDPSRAAGRARRFGQLSFADALDHGGRVVQAKALVFAAAHAQGFEVAACDRAASTWVGPQATRSMAAAAPAVALRVGLLGLGTVGMGVARALERRRKRLQLVRVLVRDLDKRREDDAPLDRLCARGELVIDSGIDVLVELIGGLEPAHELVASALARGIDVVTANKQLLARHGVELERLAALHGSRILDAGSVGGALPVLERVRALAHRPGLECVEGVLNGTSNFVLERLARGAERAAALDEAMALGLAEADSSRDLDGSDVADKLTLIARAGFPGCTPRWLERRGLEALEAGRVAAARDAGRALRLVGRCVRSADEVLLSVAPREVEREHALWSLPGAQNRVVLTACDGTRTQLEGLGAGRAPTTLAVLADLLELAREREEAGFRGARGA